MSHKFNWKDPQFILFFNEALTVEIQENTLQISDTVNQEIID